MDAPPGTFWCLLPRHFLPLGRLAPAWHRFSALGLAQNTRQNARQLGTWTLAWIGRNHYGYRV